MQQDFFVLRPKVTPTIYAYVLESVASHEGYLKIGYTDRDVETRVKEQLHTSGISYKILLKESAMRSDGSCFRDTDVHSVLRRKGFRQFKEGEDRNEWFACTVNDVLSAIFELREGIISEENRTLTFKMRPEQTIAVQKTIAFLIKKKKTNRIKLLSFYGTQKCVSGKLSQPISLRAKWD